MCGSDKDPAMQMLTDYLENALQFEELAKEERDPILRSQFQMQASTYRKLAAERAEKYGLTPTKAPGKATDLAPYAWLGPNRSCRAASQVTLELVQIEAS
jgi:hypothetical protein